jgi:Transcription-silencing protein, cryptic loci regulator Clr2
MFDHQRHNKSDLYIYGMLFFVVRSCSLGNESFHPPLIGHPSKERFRSALQFRRHLLWLDQKSTRPPCGCKLCALLPEVSEKKVVDVPEKEQDKKQKNEPRIAQRQQQKVRRAEKKNKLLSPAPRAVSQTRRSATLMSPSGSNEGTMERTPSQEHVVTEVLTPHKLGLSNPLPLKSRNKKFERYEVG